MNFKTIFLLHMVLAPLVFFAQQQEIITGGTSTSATDTGNIIIVVPTEFSPDGDGVNDVLYVKALNVANFSFELYSRWGDLVYKTKDVSAGWDGKNKKGKSYPKGTYYYILSYDDYFKKHKPKKGFIELK